MSETYERIWLQCPNTDPENEWCGEVTWCQDKINDDDVEYVRSDIVESLRQRVKELEKENAALKAKQVYELAPYWTNPNWKMPEIT